MNRLLRAVLVSEGTISYVPRHSPTKLLRFARPAGLLPPSKLDIEASLGAFPVWKETQPRSAAGQKGKTQKFRVQEESVERRFEEAFFDH